MAPDYQLYSGFTINDALSAAGAPPYDVPFQVGEPPVSFFTQPPPGSAAIFSTLHGKRPFRYVENPTDERHGAYWWAAEIQRVCDEIRRNLPDACRNIETPQSYWDLYKYFDAFDIYWRGAQNLWNVINTFVSENKYIRNIVAQEQHTQILKYTPLFDVLAVNTLKNAEVRMKLLAWNKAKEADVLKTLTTGELQSFKGLVKYPEHLLDVVRSIYERQFEKLRNSHQPYSHPATHDKQSSTSNLLADLQHDLQNSNAMDDPFMDKFEVPNRIVNGIVIADGSIETARRRANRDALLAKNGKHSQQNDVRVGAPALRKEDTPYDDSENSVSLQEPSSLPAKGLTTPNAYDGPTMERCSSAPLVGNNQMTTSHSVTEENRVSPDDSLKVAEKFMTSEKPVVPMGSNNKTSDSTISYQDGALVHDNHARQQQITQQAPRQIPSAANQIPAPCYPQHPSTANNGYTRYPSDQLPVSPFPPARVPGNHIPSEPFAHQLPPFALQQRTVNSPSSPHLVYMQNGAPPPLQIGVGQPCNGGESFQQHKRQQSSNGRWHHVGSDEIHGPKAVFRKESVSSQNGHYHGTSQSHGQGPIAQMNRHAPTNGNYTPHQRLGNTHIQPQHNNKGINNIAGHYKHNSQGSTNLGQSFVNRGCVNAGKASVPSNKFHPCPCNECHGRDCCIYVSGLPEDINLESHILECFRQHFERYGHVEKVAWIKIRKPALHVKFSSPQFAIAAVQGSNSAIIQGLALKVKVNFRTGSQYFTPPVATYAPRDYHNAYQTTTPLPANPSTFPAYQQPVGNRPAPLTHAVAVFNRRATQSGFGTERYEKTADAELSSQPTTSEPAYTPISADFSASHQTSISPSPHNSQTEEGLLRAAPLSSVEQAQGSSSSITPASGAVLDFGTVRIRPDKAQYVAASEIFQGYNVGQTGHQVASQGNQFPTTETATEKTGQATNNQRTTYKGKKNNNRQTADQQSNSSSSQSKNGAGEMGASDGTVKRKKKNNNKKRNQTSGLRSDVTEMHAAPASLDAPVSDPTISEQTDSLATTIPQHTSPSPINDINHMHPVTATAAPHSFSALPPEPFPIYCDLMSGPQLPPQRGDTGLSGSHIIKDVAVADDELTIGLEVQPDGDDNRLNPTAQDFTPGSSTITPQKINDEQVKIEEERPTQSLPEQQPKLEIRASAPQTATGSEEIDQGGNNEAPETSTSTSTSENTSTKYRYIPNAAEVYVMAMPEKQTVPRMGKGKGKERQNSGLLSPTANKTVIDSEEEIIMSSPRSENMKRAEEQDTIIPSSLPTTPAKTKKTKKTNKKGKKGKKGKKVKRNNSKNSNSEEEESPSSSRPESPTGHNSDCASTTRSSSCTEGRYTPHVLDSVLTSPRLDHEIPELEELELSFIEADIKEEIEAAVAEAYIASTTEPTTTTTTTQKIARPSFTAADFPALLQATTTSPATSTKAKTPALAPIPLVNPGTWRRAGGGKGKQK